MIERAERVLPMAKMPTNDTEDAARKLRLGAAVKQAREAARRSQTDLAKDAGIDWTTLSKIERGQQAPSVLTMATVADVLGLSLDELIGRKYRRPDLILRADGMDVELSMKVDREDRGPANTDHERMILVQLAHVLEGAGFPVEIPGGALRRDHSVAMDRAEADYSIALEDGTILQIDVKASGDRGLHPGDEATSNAIHFMADSLGATVVRDRRLADAGVSLLPGRPTGEPRFATREEFQELRDHFDDQLRKLREALAADAKARAEALIMDQESGAKPRARGKRQ